MYATAPMMHAARTAMTIARSMLISGVSVSGSIITDAEDAGPTLTNVDADELPYASEPSKDATIS